MKARVLLSMLSLFCLSHVPAFGLSDWQTVATSTENSQYYRIPAIIKLPDGKYLMAYDNRGYSNVDLAGKKLIKTVYKLGEFDGSKMILGSETNLVSDNSIINASGKIQMDHGDVALAVDISSPEYAASQHVVAVLAADQAFNAKYGKILVGHSFNGANTWTDVKEMQFVEGSSLPAHDRGFVASGNMLSTKDGIYCVVMTANDGVDNERKHSVLKSVDGGYKWEVLTTIDGSLLDETKLVQLSDGSLLMSSRPKTYGTRQFHKSTDGGKTWTAFTPKGDTMRDPSINAAVINVNYKGKNYLVHSALNSTTSFRQNLTIFWSDDNGETWNLWKEIQSGACGYSDLVDMGNGTIGCFAEIGINPTSTTYNMEFCSFSMSELLDDTQGQVDEYIGDLACNGKGYATMSDLDALSIAENGEMTITMKMLINGDPTKLQMGMFGYRGSTGTYSIKTNYTYWENWQTKYYYKGNTSLNGIEAYAYSSAQNPFGVNVSYEGCTILNPGSYGLLANQALESITFDFSKYIHLAVVVNSKEGTVRIYNNGVCVQEQKSSNATNTDLTTQRTDFIGKAIKAVKPLLIGGRYQRENSADGESYDWVFMPDSYFNSNIDDFRIYGKALTEAEVQEDMESGFPIFDKQSGYLRMAHDFAETTADGKAFVDISGNGEGLNAVLSESSHWPAVEEKLTVTPKVSATNGASNPGKLYVTRFFDGEEQTLPVGEDYMSAYREDFKILYAEPNEGFELEKILVNGAVWNGKPFIKAEDNTVIEAVFAPINHRRIFLVGDVNNFATEQPDYEFKKVDVATLSNDMQAIVDEGQEDHVYSLSLGSLRGDFHMQVMTYTDEAEQEQKFDSRLHAGIQYMYTGELGENDGVNIAPMTPFVEALPFSYSPDNVYDLECNRHRHSNLIKFTTHAKSVLTSVDNPVLYLQFDPTNHDMNKFWLDYSGIPTGIEDVAGNDAEAEYYNLQGIRVSAGSLAPGIYVVRRGSEVRKVYVR